MIKDIEKLLVVLKYYGKIWGRTRFQKIIFLLKEKYGVKFNYKFIPYHYGPYSQDLQYEIDMLNALGLIDINPEDGILYSHQLTAEGKKAADKMEEKIDPAELRKIISAIDKLRSKSTESLIKQAKKIAGIPL